MALTVGQLKAILNGDGVSDAMIVVLARDTEGNGYRPMASDEGKQIWSHSLGFYDREERDVIACPGEDEKDQDALDNWDWAQEHAQAALVLWPE